MVASAVEVVGPSSAAHDANGTEHGGTDHALDPACEPWHQPGSTPERPAVGPAGFFANRGGCFGGMMAGLLGAGLFGLLFGSGLFGGLGGLASILGLALQVLLVVWVVRLALRWFQRRNQPAYAGPAGTFAREGATSFGGDRAAPGTGSGFAPVRQEPIQLVPADFDAFERLLEVVQTAYGKGEAAALRAVTTSEVAGFLEEELEADAARGEVNRVEQPKLLQGDLSEAWREDGVDYATVAMRFSIIDYTMDRATGSLVSGDRERPSEVVEIWTFTRPRGGDWKLAAIQQG